MVKNGFEEEFDNFPGTDGSGACRDVRKDAEVTRHERGAQENINDCEGKSEKGKTSSAVDKTVATVPDETRPKIITVRYTYTDETSDAKVIVPTIVTGDTSTGAEVSFALAYALAGVMLCLTGTEYKGEKEKLANAILNVIARELIKGSMLRSILDMGMED